MKNSLLLSIIFLFTLAANSTPPSSAAARAAPTKDQTDFVATLCNTTTVLYRKLCRESLSPYAAVVDKNTTVLAHVAVVISLKKANAVAAYVENVTTSTALKECSGHLRDALHEMRRSLRQMKRLAGGGGAAERKKKMATRELVSDVQTWMSAAETDQDNCLDGARVNADVQGQVVALKMLTSNALAMVNAFAGKVAGP
ncbi:unnamed protein product [Cuscuta campestris]|uniref:Pectinesterase inhibitor domain-containing protein n=1 Tax=Cuscuta campestris TaxID=132261 RepID=A0A484KL96_9ASTE|nr:unnamed protein product [Cuscuta campestris]